jgi:hypothetical protein
MALRLVSNSPLAILLQQFFSPSEIFTSKSLHTKKPKSKSLKAKAKAPKQKPQSKGKSLASSFSESFIPSGKWGGAAVPEKGLDIVTGETCIPASLNVNNSEAAVLDFPLPWLGLCLSRPTDNLRKNC